jgi:hypothetical protein
MFRTKFVEKIKTQIVCSKTFHRKSCRLWDNVEKYVRARQVTDDNIIQGMHFACWITKATDTHSEYVILIAFPRQQCLYELPQCYLIRTFSVLFNVKRSGTCSNHCTLKLSKIARLLVPFANFIKANNNIGLQIENNFYLNGMFNKQKTRVCGTEHFPLNLVNCRVWRSLSTVLVVGQYC